MAKSTISNGQAGLSVRTALNTMFSELYAGNVPPTYVAGRWYVPFLGMGVGGGNAPSNNVIAFIPFILPAPITVSDLATRVTIAGTTSNCQLAIYGADATTLKPTGNALAVTASMATTSATLITADITGSNVTLQPGLYYMAVNTDASTARFQTILNSSGVGNSIIGSTTPGNVWSGSGSGGVTFTLAQTYGTWPDVTAASFTEVFNNTANAAILTKAA